MSALPTPRAILRAVTHWHIDSQQTARRNALVATTALTERRRERQDVEEFLALHARRWEAAQGHRWAEPPLLAAH